MGEDETQMFEEIKHVNEKGKQFWDARELQHLYEYKEWRNFLKVIEKAKRECEKNKIDPDQHFYNVVKLAPMPKGGSRKIENFELTAYACYLIGKNADNRKPVINSSRKYFEKLADAS